MAWCVEREAEAMTGASNSYNMSGWIFRGLIALLGAFVGLILGIFMSDWIQPRCKGLGGESGQIVIAICRGPEPLWWLLVAMSLVGAGFAWYLAGRRWPR
jgi:hypothetical protein